MTGSQKVIKYIAIGLAALLAVSIISGMISAVGFFGGFLFNDATTEDMKGYTGFSDIHSVDIDINAADITIEQGDAFAVESNLKHLTVKDENGLLSIKETKKPFGNYDKSTLVIKIPDGTVFDKAELKTGAGRLVVDTLSAKVLDCDFGAGVGESNITLLGTKDDYTLDVEKGLGNISVDGDNISNISGIGDGQNEVEINGGVGAIHVKYAEND